jgi:hypothetical protein
VETKPTKTRGEKTIQKKERRKLPKPVEAKTNQNPWRQSQPKQGGRKPTKTSGDKPSQNL